MRPAERFSLVSGTGATLLLLGLFTPITLVRSQQPAKPKLKLELSTTSAKVCTGEKLPLKLKVTNVGEDQLRLCKECLWQNFMCSLIESDGNRTGYGIHFEPESFFKPRTSPDEPVLLKPKETYEDKFEFSSFVNKPGRQELKITYDLIDSNNLSIEMVRCN